MSLPPTIEMLARLAAGLAGARAGTRERWR